MSSKKSKKEPEYPEINEEEVKETRRRYHILLDKIHAVSAVEETTEILDEANKLLAGVKKPQEAHLDSKVFKEVVQKYSENADMRRGKTSLFQAHEFAAKLCDYESIKHWIKIGQDVQGKIKRPVPLDYLYGAIEKGESDEVSPAKKRRRIVAKSNEPLVASKLTMQTAETSAKAAKKGLSVDELVKLVEKALTRACRKLDSDYIHYFKFVIHPQSFTATVEAMFYASFLVKENKASIRFIDDVPHIGLPRHFEKGSRAAAGNQVAMQITRRQWLKWVEILDISEPIINLPGYAQQD